MIVGIVCIIGLAWIVVDFIIGGFREAEEINKQKKNNDERNIDENNE